MEQSSITVIEALEGLAEPFSPVKITLNGIVLYDDWNFDETDPPLEALRKRFWRYEDYFVKQIKIEIADFHHSFVHLTCEQRETSK